MGTESGNPPLTGDSHSSALTVASSDPADGADLWVRELWVAFDAVYVARGEGCAAVDPSPAAEGVSGDIIGGLDLGRLPGTDAACGVRVVLRGADAVPPSAPPAFRGASFLLVGENARGERVEARTIGESRSFELRGDAPFDLRAGKILAFDLSALVTGLALEGRAPDSDGVVRVEGEVVADAVRGALGLFPDLDADGRLGSADIAAGSHAHHR